MMRVRVRSARSRLARHSAGDGFVDDKSTAPLQPYFATLDVAMVGKLKFDFREIPDVLLLRREAARAAGVGLTGEELRYA